MGTRGRRDSGGRRRAAGALSSEYRPNGRFSYPSCFPHRSLSRPLENVSLSTNIVRHFSHYTSRFLADVVLLGQKLLYAIENHGVVILVGQTGSGKTTREALIHCTLLTPSHRY